MRRTLHVLGLALIAGLAGCATAASRPTGSAEPAAGAPAPIGYVRVISGSTLADNPGLNVLQVIARAMPDIRVAQTPGGCPVVWIRGASTIFGSPNPSVYVDGTRAGDTCVLSSFSAVNVSRIEIYPLGVTSRPGYDVNSNGLILIFTKRASDEIGA